MGMIAPKRSALTCAATESTYSNSFKTLSIATLAALSLSPLTLAHADTSDANLNAMQAQLDALRTQVQTLEKQLGDMRQKSTPPAPVAHAKGPKPPKPPKPDPVLASNKLPDMDSEARYVIKGEDNGYLAVGGDVELNLDGFNGQEKSHLFLPSDESGEEKNSKSGMDLNGRLLLEVAGMRQMGENYASFKVQPLLFSNGNVGLDDAWFGFGEKNNWQIKVGRFEAYDLFPVGADTFLDFSGDSANDLYSDGVGYIYMAKEGRGRSGAGQLLASKTLGNAYFELSTVIGDRSDLFGKSSYSDEKTYHGVKIDESEGRNSFIVRPLVAYQFNENWKVAGGMEANLVTDAVEDELGRDVSDRTGYSATLGYQQGLFQWNLSAAYLDALDEEDTSIGTNFQYGPWGLGYIYANNSIDSYFMQDGKSYEEHVLDNDSYHINTVYASYRFDQVLNIPNFQILLGGFFSEVGIADQDDFYGGRMRFKYFF